MCNLVYMKDNSYGKCSSCGKIIDAGVHMRNVVHVGMKFMRKTVMRNVVHV
mgnify:CR=1 FL=1